MNVINLRTNKENFKNAEFNYWVFENAVTKETCQDIINLGKDRWQVGEIQRNVVSKKSVDEQSRKSDVAWSNDQWLYELCWDYLNSANTNSNWNFKIDSCELMQITRYKTNGHYDFHFDGNGFTAYNMPNNKFLHRKTRKLSMTIVLNEDYEGGEFEFFDDKRLIKEKTGTVIVFPSYIVHRVRPVTKGIRYSLVVWFCGEPFV